jgi:hypothetical protein
MKQDTSLNVKVYGIPDKWNVCCWLADTLTSALVESQAEDSHQKMQDIMSILVEVAKELHHPSLLGEIIFNLLTRIVKKTRVLLKLNKNCKKIAPKTKEDQEKLYENLYGFKEEFIQSVYKEIKEVKEN